MDSNLKRLRRTEYGPLVEAAIEAGWTLERTGGNHLKLISPEGRAVFFPSSPSDWRGARNLRSTLRSYGLKI
jgi:predicted RNA binding protein YcfA (HicA-like mRNA interferase family)